jgi:hypothetical protein
MGSPLCKRGVRGDFVKIFESIGVLHIPKGFFVSSKRLGIENRNSCTNFKLKDEESL